MEHPQPTSAAPVELPPPGQHALSAVAEAPEVAASWQAWAYLGSAAALLAALAGVYAAGFERHSGVFLLLAMVAFAAYLAVPRNRRFAGVDRAWDRWDAMVDRVTLPALSSADAMRDSHARRRELARMQAVRQVRVNDLGEQAYRYLDGRGNPDELREAARRVAQVDAQIRAFRESGGSAALPGVAAEGLPRGASGP